MADDSEQKHTKQQAEKNQAINALSKAKNIEKGLLSIGYNYVKIDSKTLVLRRKKN